MTPLVIAPPRFCLRHAFTGVLIALLCLLASCQGPSGASGRWAQNPQSTAAIGKLVSLLDRSTASDKTVFAAYRSTSPDPLALFTPPPPKGTPVDSRIDTERWQYSGVRCDAAGNLFFTERQITETIDPQKRKAPDLLDISQHHRIVLPNVNPASIQVYAKQEGSSQLVVLQKSWVVKMETKHGQNLDFTNYSGEHENKLWMAMLHFQTEAKARQFEQALRVFLGAAHS